MKVPTSLTYWLRTAQIDPKRLAGETTAVVFIHGLISHSDTAFKLKNVSGRFFWDLLIDEFPFQDSSFFAFNYGRLELSHITEGRTLEQSLQNICQQLHGAISGYRNIVLIGHSQGGLVAKMYACMYGGHANSDQAVLVITLHTPHRNQSKLLMRHTRNNQWIDEDRYFVPHLFCASYADNLVKPDNAIDSALDASFTAYNREFRRLGHSHLNQAPTTELINRIRKKGAEFLSSGYSFPGVEISAVPKKDHPGLILRFSRSKKKIEAILEKEKAQPAFSGAPFRNFYSYAVRCPVHLAKLANIANFDTKEDIEILDLDNYFSTGIFDTVDWVCDEAEGKYKELLFDPFDFKADKIMKNEDFLHYFKAELVLADHSLRKQLTNSSFEITMRCFLKGLDAFWSSIVGDIYSSIEDERKPKITTFKRCVERATRVCFEQKRFRKQKFLYQIYKREFSEFGWSTEVRSIDQIIAQIFRTDGEIYRLDRDISNIFGRCPLGSD